MAGRHLTPHIGNQHLSTLVISWIPLLITRYILTNRIFINIPNTSYLNIGYNVHFSNKFRSSMKYWQTKKRSSSETKIGAKVCKIIVSWNNKLECQRNNARKKQNSDIQQWCFQLSRVWFTTGDDCVVKCDESRRACSLRGQIICQYWYGKYLFN